MPDKMQYLVIEKIEESLIRPEGQVRTGQKTGAYFQNTGITRPAIVPDCAIWDNLNCKRKSGKKDD